MKIYICNAFSLAMLDRHEQRGTPRGYIPRGEDVDITARVPRPIDDPLVFLHGWETRGKAEIISAVGHADTATIFSRILQRHIEHNRLTLKTGPGVMFLIGQYVGPRLPEGVTELPEDATIEWWIL